MTKKSKADDSGGSYVLDIDEHVPHVKPSDYGVDAIKGIKPSDYFITSGDAVVKAAHLAADLASLAAEARRHGKKGEGIGARYDDLAAALASAARRARALVALLERVKGTNIFLELEWKDHELHCIPKNPRSKDAEDVE